MKTKKEREHSRSFIYTIVSPARIPHTAFFVFPRPNGHGQQNPLKRRYFSSWRIAELI